MTEITGDNKDNLIDGSDAGEIISSGNGADTVNAGGGDDIIFAGNGNDTVNAGGGDDIVFAGNGNDTVNAGDGDDIVFAGNGDDTVNAGDGDDIVFAGNGNDTVNAGGGDDTVFAGNGDDTVIHVEFGNIGFDDAYYGQNGRDTLRLVLLQPTYDSALFQQELAAFQSMIASHGSASGTFTSLGIHFESFENIEVVIDPTNYAPTAIALDNASVDENNAGAAIGNLAATDPNGDTAFTYAVDDARFEVIDGQLKLVDGVSLDHEAAAAVTVNVTVADAGGLTFTQAFNVTVNDVNEAPTAIALDNASVDENAAGAVIGNLTTTDPDGDTAFTYTVDDVRFEVLDGQLKLVDDASLDHEGEPTVTVNVTTHDAGGLTFTQAFEVAVNDVNEAPTVGPATASVGTGESVGIDLLKHAADVDGDALSVSSFGQGAYGSVAYDPGSGEWIYTPDADFVGSDSFTYEVSDGALTTTGTIDFEVLPLRMADETAVVIAGTAAAERIVGNDMGNTIHSGLGAAPTG